MEESIYKQIEASLSSSIRMKLDNIRNYLSYGNASVMVGAGFSRNADMDETVSMKDWNSLAKIFFQKLYSRTPTGEDLAFKTPMRLASLVETSFGRTELDKMIYESLPDERIAPGEIHKSFLNLKWKDIFTTNYDRLLEKAAIDSERHYNIVTNKETLIYTQSPRIIKLHGSFPDIHPFIMTEEDYRIYPSKYPEFVNSVRQALIENVFCLIGFSGDDPNFLSWIGWLRDVMGNLSSPIYLITYDKTFHDAESTLLKTRKLDVINFAEVEGIRGYKEAFVFLFKYLESQEQDLWNDLDFTINLDTTEGVKRTISKAKAIRTSYPGWLLMPQSYYHCFSDCSRSFPFMEKDLNNISDKDLRFQFIYELDWRLSISLTPKNVDWYVNELEAISYDGNDAPVLRVQKHSLKISLLTIYRSQLAVDSFKKIVKLICDTKDRLPIDLQRRFFYERALMAVSVLDYKQTDEILKMWHPSRFDYIGEIWKALILIEIGKQKDARDLLNETYQTIRTQLVIINNAYSPLLSSCRLQIENILHLITYNRSKRNISELDYDADFYTICNNCKDKLHELGENKQYLEYHDFNIGSRRTTWKGDSGFDGRYLYSYRLVRLFENAGYPFGLPNYSINVKEQNEALSKLISFDFFFSATVLIRGCCENLIKDILNRRHLVDLSRKDADYLFNIYYPCLKTSSDTEDKTIMARQKSIVELLSYLSVKASQEKITPLVNNLIRLKYEKNLETVYNSLTKDSLSKILPILYCIPIKGDKYENDILFPKTQSIKIKLPKQAVDIMYNGLISDNRYTSDAAYHRIASTYKDLSKTNQNRFSKIIIKWRNAETMSLNMLYSYNLIPYDAKKESKSIDTIISQLVKEFMEKDYVFNNNSNSISELSSGIRRLTPLAKYIPYDIQETIISKVMDYLVTNETDLKKNDIKEFFGGIRSFSRSLFFTLQEFVRCLDMQKVNKDMLYSFTKVIIRYGTYDFRYLIILSCINSHIQKYNVIELIKESLFHNDYTKDDDALVALYLEFKTKFDTNIFERIMNYIAFSVDSNKNRYIRFIKDIVDDNFIPSSYNPNFEDMLNQLYDMIDRDDIPVEDLMEMEYETLRFVDSLISRYPKMKDSKIVYKWLRLNVSPNLFNDVRLK